MVNQPLPLLALLLAGCGGSSGPREKDEGFASLYVWVDTYKMEMAALPRVTWYSECLAQYKNVSLQDGCITEVVDPTASDEVQVLWQGSYSASAYAEALAKYKFFLMHGSLDGVVFSDEFRAIGNANVLLLEKHL